MRRPVLIAFATGMALMALLAAAPGDRQQDAAGLFHARIMPDLQAPRTTVLSAPPLRTHSAALATAIRTDPTGNPTLSRDRPDRPDRWSLSRDRPDRPDRWSLSRERPGRPTGLPLPSAADSQSKDQQGQD